MNDLSGMKEYLIAFQYRNVGNELKWGTTIRRCKMTGVNIARIEDELRHCFRVDVVRIMHFSELELESDSEGV